MSGILDSVAVGFERASWRTAAATVSGYVVLLLVVFAVLFVVPYALFLAL